MQDVSANEQALALGLTDLSCRFTFPILFFFLLDLLDLEGDPPWILLEIVEHGTLVKVDVLIREQLVLVE